LNEDLSATLTLELPRGGFATHNVERVGTTIERNQQEEAGYY